MSGKRCSTCRHWNAHSTDMVVGDCMHQQEDGPIHRAYHLEMPDGGVAYMDSFGKEETKPNHSCSFWDDGERADS